MIQLVLDSLNIKANYIFIVQSKHQKKYNIKSLLKTLYPTSIILETNGVTKGAACTTLLAKKFIDNSNRLIIANSDQFIEWNPGKTLYDIYTKNVDGAILVFKSLHPKWSYAKVDSNDYVVEVAEKKVISDLATVGVYYWRRGSDYIKYAKNMIKKNIKTNGEFYVCPVFNEAILEKKRIKVAHVDNMWGLGTPEDLNYFKENYNFYKRNKIF
jgi:dTDP-glucose pyrophosphorylase